MLQTRSSVSRSLFELIQDGQHAARIPIAPALRDIINDRVARYLVVDGVEDMIQGRQVISARLWEVGGAPFVLTDQQFQG